MSWFKRRGKMYVKKLDENAIIPEYKSKGAAGFDLHACLNCASVAVLPGDEREIPCGIAVAIEPGFELQIRSRSGFRFRKKVSVYLGTIDNDYRGELTVLVENHGIFPFTVKNGMRIAQGVVAPIEQVEIIVTDKLPKTERGTKGFGSTGTD